MNEPSITNLLPAEYAAYEKALTGDSGLNDARASLALLSQAKASLLRSSGAEEQDRTSAYRATWRLCLRAMQKSSDQAAKQLILDHWNISLADGGAATPSQVYALAEQWDRILLTDEFWKTLQETKNRKTVSAIGYALYLHGNEDDLHRMLTIEEQTPGRGLPNAISWLRYRLSGDTTHPGPAAAPPRME